MNVQSTLSAGRGTAPPALIVVGRAGEEACKPDVDPRLLAALPRARRVLELGCSGDALARAYRKLHPEVQWTALDLADADAAASAWPQSTEPMKFDLIVLADVFPWLADPVGLLSELARRAAPEGRLVLSTEHHARLGSLAQLLDGDLGATPRPAGLRGQPRLLSPSILYRQLMDAGWMPTLADHHSEVDPGAPARAALQALASCLGQTSGGAAERTRDMARLIIEARPVFAQTPEKELAKQAVTPAGAALFDVLVPTNDERQLRLNVECSPGLSEVGARIVSCRGAATPAEAFEQGTLHASAEWVLLCHQDVYFPAGFGSRLNALLAAIPADQRARTLLGFVGLAAGANGQGAAPAGFVIDRLHRVDHPATEAAVSIDELAVVMSRDTLHRIDPQLGWHLWATDLCLSAICTHQVFPRIVRLPLFHNSRTGWQLPRGFQASAQRLIQKWAGFGPIHTLCGVLDASLPPAVPVSP